MSSSIDQILKKNNNKSLKNILSSWVGLVVFGSYIVLAIAIYASVLRYMDIRISDELGNKQRHLQHLVRENSKALGNSVLEHKIGEFIRSHPEYDVNAVTMEGAPIYSGTKNLENNKDVNAHIFTAKRYSSNESDVEFTLLFTNTSDLELLRWLLITLVVASITAVVLVFLAIKYVIKMEFKYVNDLVDSLDRVSLDGKNIYQTRSPLEVQPLIIKYNAVIDEMIETYNKMERYSVDVSHELKTPLTTLITSSELSLNNNQLSSVEIENIQSNLEEYYRMTEIVNCIMTLSKIEFQSEAQREYVSSIRSHVLDVVSYYSSLLDEMEISVSVNGDDHGDINIALFHRSISNILRNAIRFAHSKTIIYIHIGKSENGETGITVTNKGDPVSSEEIENLFNRYYRKDGTIEHSSSNHGIGLSIVSAVAKMHGGETQARSEGGLTSVGFTISKIY